ncbi:inositol monophosphatase [Bradyrhizobium sp. ISRA443]|uniref:inositol monophosphatase family protein n=1 Tax=unclassified Bradyrhizobium TaxID=2631580 RepID=UPI00247AC5BE|nr:MULTISPECIES: inositol monophosphatase [unclassified Bradyrhizobium]WGR92724.1 inositol monophosphatase [Bradyrhizobium sp. ISRA435]WGR97176.1 inositol monophosphatase [Bradyrhizobium sp. ISRA436]WGS04064.1 inositol monophosphatase [Bradyrhizobium sp. ISRA437]WGS10947.1 inositol monophosphatase [Bradyrhizobium sp. ISRA443]
MKLSHADALIIGNILADVGRTEIMPRFRRVREIEVRTKTSAFDVVTEADEAAEQAISAALLRAFPGAAIIGEEGTARDPAALDHVGTAELAFIIDPIDGTRNFTSSLPLFGSMVAATMRGEIVFGAIHDPVCSDTAFALRGEGAWLAAQDGKRHDLKVAAAAPVKEMDAVIGVNFVLEPLRTTVTGNLSKLGMSAWLRCSAHEYRMAASGHCHLLFYNKLMPWDHAAGWLLHREAGGYSAHFDGSPYKPVNLAGGLLCAPDEASWHAAKQAILTPGG